MSPSDDELVRTIEALLFLSTQPVSEIALAEACQADLEEIQAAVQALDDDLAPGRRGIVLRRVGEGLTLATEPSTEQAARRLLSKPRTPPLTQAQAETQNEQYMELLRQDLRTNKLAVMTEAMSLTDEQGEVFW
ncbi:MAG: SMC-Scp complex subunit ScpB, partial [Acidobacteriota bacterium]